MNEVTAPRPATEAQRDQDSIVPQDSRWVSVAAVAGVVLFVVVLVELAFVPAVFPW